MVNNTANAMLLSVHQNTFTDPRYRGAQTFFGSGELSRQWGELTQQLLRSVLQTENDRKAKPVPEHVYLFKHISCPGILVECGFLTSAEDAALLVTEQYQKKIALVLSGAYLQMIHTIPQIAGGD